MPAKRRLVRTFNYTKRMRINASDVDIETGVDAAGKPIARVKKITLPEDGDTPHDARRWRNSAVVLDAWRHRTGSWMTANLGKVADIRKLKGIVSQPRLEEFETPEGITFRIKVVAADDCQLLAEAERILPSNEPRAADVDELLPVRKTPDLGQEPWRIEWSPERGPVALVSSLLIGADNFFHRDGAFIAAMVPEMLRSVLIRICASEDYRDEPWASKWFEFAARYFDAEPPARKDWDDAEDWANKVVERFCSDLELVSKANDAMTRDQHQGE